jgi:hypothetical protein
MFLDSSLIKWIIKQKRKMPTTVENSSFDGDGVARFQKFFVDGAKGIGRKEGRQRPIHL